MQSVQDLIGAELSLFEQKFAASVRGSNVLLDRIMRFIIKRKGKQMRPMFVFLSAKIAGGITEPTYRAASLIELLHTATLVHDDVVDNSMIRRSFFSVNALWKNKIAVLVGDFLLSKGLLLSMKHDDYRFLKIVSTAMEQMIEGELLQVEKVRRMDIEEKVYYEVIRQKTASLIASCCECGAASAGAGDETIEKMRLFGEKIGIAFQIKDDMFDFGTDDVGKPLGIDIKEKKVTLPLIYSLNNSKSDVKKQMINLVKNHNDDPEKIARIISFVKETGGLQYAETQMKKYQDEAFAILNTFPDGESRRSLEQLVRFTTERNK